MHIAIKDKINAVPHHIKAIRLKRKYKQEYMALRLSISQNAYSKIELGMTKLTIERVFAIADILDVDPITLITN